MKTFTDNIVDLWILSLKNLMVKIWIYYGQWKSSILLKTSHNLYNVEQKRNKSWTLRFSMHQVRGAFDVHVKLIFG